MRTARARTRGSPSAGVSQTGAPMRALGRDRVRCRYASPPVARMEPTGPREARPDDRLRVMRGGGAAGHPPGFRFAPSGLRVFLIYNVKQPSFFIPGSLRVRVLLLPLLTFVAADPRARGLAERRETSQPCTCRAVTRDATLARRGPSRATGRPPHGAPPWRCRPGTAFVPGDWPVAGLTRRPRVPLALLPGCGAGLFVSAVTSRGRRHIPLRLQDRF